jgi:GNAT superfamily N-acetyltransferase
MTVIATVSMTQRTAEHLRLWARDGSTMAIGLLDSGVLRLAITPDAVFDDDLANEIAADLDDPRSGVIPTGQSVIEARGAHALSRLLKEKGWADDEPWTPLTLSLEENRAPEGRSRRADLRVESVATDAAEQWISVHWSAFKSVPLDADTRKRLAQRWEAMRTGPASALGHHLIGYDRDDRPVAITSVWTAGAGRPGLIEPLGVHRDHHGHGYGVAITDAGTRLLREAGASSAVVVAENSNSAALSTYLAAGFTPRPVVMDLAKT